MSRFLRLSLFELIPFAFVPPTDNLVVLKSLVFLRFFFLLLRVLSILAEDILCFALFVDAVGHSIDDGVFDLEDIR